MGIDGIGKGGPPAPPKPVTGTERAHGGEAPRAFEVDPGRKAAAAVAPVAPAGTTPLDRLRAGEIDLDPGRTQRKSCGKKIHQIVGCCLSGARRRRNEKAGDWAKRLVYPAILNH